MTEDEGQGAPLRTKRPAVRFAPRQLANLARPALVWTYGCGAAVLLVQLAYTATTARALPPSTFGPFAASQAMVQMLSYLSLNASGSAVARLTSVTRSLVGSAWSLAMLGGGAAALLAAAGSGLWSRAWGLPDSSTMILCSTPAIFLTPLSTLSLALLRQRLRYRAAALAELLGTALGLGVTGFLVLQTHRSWLLPVALGAASLATIVTTSVLLGERPFLRWSASDVRGLVGFIGPVSALNAVYAALNAWPQLVVSRLFGATAVAHLSRATMIVTLPQSQLSFGLMKVIYPLFSRLGDRPGSWRQGTTATLVVASGGAALLFGSIGGSALPIVRLLLGDQWLPITPLVPLVAIGALGYILMGLISAILESVGHLRQIMLTQAVLMGGVVVPSAILWAGGRLSVTAVLWVFAGAQILGHGFQLALLGRSGRVDVIVVLRAYAIHGAIGLSVGALLNWAAETVRYEPPLVAAAVQVAAGGVILVVLSGIRWAVPAWSTAWGRSHGRHRAEHPSASSGGRMVIGG